MLPAGRWREARAALAKSAELHAGGDAADHFFLAMTHERLEEHEAALQAHAKAIAWMDHHKPGDGELQRFRAESQAVVNP